VKTSARVDRSFPRPLPLGSPWWIATAAAASRSRDSASAPLSLVSRSETCDRASLRLRLTQPRQTLHFTALNTDSALHHHCTPRLGWTRTRSRPPWPMSTGGRESPRGASRRQSPRLRRLSMISGWAITRAIQRWRPWSWTLPRRARSTRTSTTPSPRSSLWISSRPTSRRWKLSFSPWKV